MRWYIVTLALSIEVQKEKIAQPEREKYYTQLTGFPKGRDRRGLVPPTGGRNAILPEGRALGAPPQLRARNAACRHGTRPGRPRRCLAARPAAARAAQRAGLPPSGAAVLGPGAGAGSSDSAIRLVVN